MAYDIFLGGPWEDKAHEPYKTKIKRAFPNNRIFDPEEQTSQKDGTWFVDNYWAILSSKTMVSFVPSFPFPGVGPEVGIFYHEHCDWNLLEPLKELVIIWPDFVKPDHGKSVARRMGYIVENTGEAIARLRPILYD